MFIILVIEIFFHGAIATELQYNDCAPVGSYKVDRIVMKLDCLDSICCLPVKKTSKYHNFVSSKQYKGRGFNTKSFCYDCWNYERC